MGASPPSPQSPRPTNLTPSVLPRPTSDQASPSSTAPFVFCAGCAPGSPALHPAAMSLAAFPAAVPMPCPPPLLLLRLRALLVGAPPALPARSPRAASAAVSSVPAVPASSVASAAAGVAAAGLTPSSFSASVVFFDDDDADDDAGSPQYLCAASARAQSPRALATSIASAAHFDRSTLSDPDSSSSWQGVSSERGDGDGNGKTSASKEKPGCYFTPRLD